MQFKAKNKSTLLCIHPRTHFCAFHLCEITMVEVTMQVEIFKTDYLTHKYFYTNFFTVTVRGKYQYGGPLARQVLGFNLNSSAWSLHASVVSRCSGFYSPKANPLGQLVIQNCQSVLSMSTCNFCSHLNVTILVIFQKNILCCIYTSLKSYKIHLFFQEFQFLPS